MHLFKKISRRNKQPKQVSVGDVLTKISGILPSVGASVVAISTIGYVVGWLMIKNYYGEIGASWYYKTYSPTAIFKEASSILMLLIISLAIGIQALMNGTKTIVIVRWEAGTGIAACILILISWVISGKADHKLAYYIGVVGSMVAATSGGLILAELIASLKDDRLKWSGRHISLLVTCCTFVLFFAPNAMESNRAKFDMSPTVSELPYVKKVGCESCIWRLVNVVDNKALLSRISDKKSARMFQIVSLNDEWIIEPFNAD